MVNSKIKVLEQLREKFGVSQESIIAYWDQQKILAEQVVDGSLEKEETDNYSFNGRYPFKVLYADNTISDAPQECKAVAIVISSRFALKLLKPEDFKKSRLTYNDAMLFAQQDVIGHKATAGSRAFWKKMAKMNAHGLKNLRQLMLSLGSEPLGNYCWIADDFDEAYAWRVSFNDKTLTTCRKCYFNEVWPILEL